MEPVARHRKEQTLARIPRRPRSPQSPPEPSQEPPEPPRVDLTEVYEPSTADPAQRAASAELSLSGGGHIPPHVWAKLQEAGQKAAERLVDLLNSPGFLKLKASDQRGLLDLALTRAYGLPVRRELKVELSSQEGDAIASSLNRLSSRITLPEHGGRKRPQ